MHLLELRLRSGIQAERIPGCVGVHASTHTCALAHRDDQKVDGVRNLKKNGRGPMAEGTATVHMREAVRPRTSGLGKKQIAGVLWDISQMAAGSRGLSQQVQDAGRKPRRQQEQAVGGLHAPYGSVSGPLSCIPKILPCL